MTGRTRAALMALWVLSALLLTVLLWRPESTTTSKLLTLCCLASLGAAPFVLLWPRRRVRRALFATLTVALLLFLLPGRARTPDSLTDAYLQHLRAFDGTHYVWGGESHRGIDCSGLVRVSLIEASLERGFTSLDPSLLRQAATLWWFDASAQALGEGYRGWTKEILRSPSLRALDLATLRKGDLAVTADGTHVLAYLGDATWIQADPVPMRVHFDPVSGASGWFGVPVVIWRWATLAP